MDTYIPNQAEYDNWDQDVAMEDLLPKPPVSLVKVTASPEVGDFAPPARPPSFATTPESRAVALFNSAANHLDNALFIMRRDYLNDLVRCDSSLRADAIGAFIEGYLTELGIAAESLRHAEELGWR